MFQYTKEVILNDESLISVANGVLTVKGYGDYKVENIVDGKIFRTVCVPGSEGKVELTASQLGVGEGEKVFTFRVVTSKPIAEFASPNWNVFGKPIIVGYNAATLKDVKEAVELVFEGNEVVKVTVDNEDEPTKLILTAADKYTSFDKLALDDEPIAVTPVANVEPFGTKDWIIENLRFPTYPNIRYASAGNMPTHAEYDELSFAYAVPRVGLGGLSGVGQGLTAVTRHIFYVPAGKITTLKNGGTELLDSVPATGNDLTEVDTDNE